MTPLRLAIVGCGRLAELGYAPAVRSLESVDVAALADPAPERRDRVARALANGAAPPPRYGSLEELLTRERPDAVVIATPVDSHLAAAELGASAGVAALVEKPPAADGKGAERLAALERPPWIGFNRRFQHAPPLMPRIPDGPIELELEISYRRASWRPHVARDDAVLDLAPHLVDLVLLLGGALDARVLSARLSPERAELELKTSRGRATIRCATDRLYRERVSVRVPGGPPAAVSEVGGAWRGIGARLRRAEHPLVASLRAQLAAFAAAARGDDPGLLASAAEGARTMRIIDRAREVAG